MEKVSWRGGALVAPVPAVMVSLGDMEKSNIITVAWCGITNTVPPKTYISVRPERHSYEILKKKREFVINLTPSSLTKKADYCGMFTGRKVDKFKECGFTKEKASKIDAPMIGECPISIECKVTDIIPLGSHDMFLADIVAVNVERSLLEGDKLCINRAHLCAFAHGEYYKLGERIGKFGFSVKKKKPINKKK
ncbi:MAG: flavin reductase family protein [Ruminococcaceae bacterium]|nr:flavin reductase family protein [Oscillospiraceae bacterium]